MDHFSLQVILYDSMCRGFRFRENILYVPIHSSDYEIFLASYFIGTYRMIPYVGGSVSIKDMLAWGGGGSSKKMHFPPEKSAYVQFFSYTYVNMLPDWLGNQLTSLLC
jgi:hypothetical protein